MSHDIVSGYALSYRGEQAEAFEELTPALAAELIQALFNTPALSVACGLCGVHYRTVKTWLLKGALPGAPAILRRFSVDMLRTEAKAIQECDAQFKIQIREGLGTAKVLLEYMKMRLPTIEAEDSVASILTNQVDQEKHRSNLLENPTPAMERQLNAHGWVREGK